MRNSAGPSWSSCLATLSLVVVAGGCVGGPHRRGEHQLTLTGLFAQPFDTDGRGDSAGATIGHDCSSSDCFFTLDPSWMR